MPIERRIETPNEAIKRLERELQRVKGLALASHAATHAKHDYVLLAQEESSGSGVQFDLTIPQTHRDLLIVWRGSIDSGTSDVLMRFNGSGGNTEHRGSGIRATSTADTITHYSVNSASRVTVGEVTTSDLTAGGTVTVPNYAVSGQAVPFTYHSWMATSSTNQRTHIGGGFWLSGNPVTRVLLNISDDWESGSIVSAYGMGAL